MTVVTIVLREADMAVRPARTRSPVSRASSRDALVYTVRDLDQDSARIMSQVEETGQPAFITRNGRFIAIIKPLAPGQIESRVLAEISRQVGKRGRAAITQQPAPHRFLARRRAGARRVRSPAPLRGLGEGLLRHLSHRRASAPAPRRS